MIEPVKTYQSSARDRLGLRTAPETVKIFVDEDSESPRDWDNLGEMLCLHRRYSLGDRHQFSADEILELVETDDVIALPLYLYDHSGITMSTGNGNWPFHCPWDSGLVGYIYVEKEAVRREWGWKRISPQRYEKILQILRSEVEIYDQYLRGDVYGYRIEDENGEEIDSCWGYFGGIEYLQEELTAMGYPPEDSES